jgi:hypothetical protein
MKATRKLHMHHAAIIRCDIITFCILSFSLLVGGLEVSEQMGSLLNLSWMKMITCFEIG